MDDDTKKSLEGEVVEKESFEQDFQGVTELLRGVVEPLAKAQEVGELEVTKRAELVAGLGTKIVIGIVVVASGALILAGYALENNNSELAEKIVIGLFAFLGGLGLGKFSGK